MLTNDHGLFFRNGNLIGYLFNFEGHGIYSPAGEEKDITPEQAQRHNELLSEGEIKGLDENCKVGQMGVFYFSPTKAVHTWSGTVVSEDYSFSPSGKVITFKRNGKVFRGTLPKNSAAFSFKRIS